MSRRKQEKPQPRKNLMQGSFDHIDLVTCGACRKDFPLSEIVRFIQHKVALCNKENSCRELLDGEDSSEEDNSSPEVLVKKEDNTSPDVLVKKEDNNKTSAKDTSATVNGIAFEPCSYVCSTCKQSLNSAWALILHAQSLHGLNICVDFSTRAPLLERQAPPPAPSQSQEPLLKSSATPPPLLELPPSEPLQDFYSQRLRVLAGATSPRKSTPPLPHTFKNILSGVTPPSPDAPTSGTDSSSPKRRLCEYCGKSFQFKSNLIVHRRSHTGEKPFKCHICDHACTQASKLKRHMKTHRNVTDNHVNGVSTTESSTKKQVNGTSEDSEDIDIEEEEIDEDINVDCIEEDDEAEEDQSGDEDSVRENGEGKLVIDHDEDHEAEAEDLTKKPLQNGISKNNNNNQLTTKQSVVSEFMEKVGFSTIPHYNEAYKQALQESSFRIKSLDQRSSDASNSSYDLLMPPYAPLNLDAKRPRLDDTSWSPVWYPKCSGGTPPNSKHKDTSNSGPRRNDTCEYCGKVFKNCSNLTVHRRSHTGEKPYKCELCNYACAQSSKLTRHMKTHGRLGKDVYRCRFCDMPFSVPSTLEKHMRKCVVSQVYPAHHTPDLDSDSKEMMAVSS